MLAVSGKNYTYLNIMFWGPGPFWTNPGPFQIIWDGFGWNDNVSLLSVMFDQLVLKNSISNGVCCHSDTDNKSQMHLLVWTFAAASEIWLVFCNRISLSTETQPYCFEAHRCDFALAEGLEQSCEQLLDSVNSAGNLNSVGIAEKKSIDSANSVDQILKYCRECT